MKEEIFGPIFPILTFTEIDQAISYIVDEQEKPLCVYYFGKMNKSKVEAETSSGAFV